MEKDRYIGETKVKDISETDKESPFGNPLFLVQFEGDAERPQYMTEKLYNIVSSKEQEDQNYVQAQKFAKIVPALVDLVGEYNLKFFQLSRLFELTHQRLENRLERASNYLWTQNDNYYAPGYNFTNDISTLDIREVINKIEEDNESEE